MRRIVVVLNPSSRDFEAKRLFPRIAPLLERGGSVRVVETEADQVATTDRIASAISSGCDRVVVIGGDGTVHLVGNVLFGRLGTPRPELAVIPFGTANNVAKSLDLPLDDFDRLAKVAAGDHLEPLDVARIKVHRDAGEEVRYFLDSVTVGMDADVLDARGRFRDLRGYLSFLPALAERAVEQQSLDMRMWIDGRAHESRAFNVIVNNVPMYAGELRMPGSRRDDGLLDVYVFNRREYASKLMSFALKQLDVLKLGVHELLEDLTANQRSFHGRSVKIRFAAPHRLQVDGEVFGAADELECQIAGQLSVATP